MAALMAATGAGGRIADWAGLTCWMIWLRLSAPPPASGRGAVSMEWIMVAAGVLIVVAAGMVTLRNEIAAAFARLVALVQDVGS